jgi:hypothetical protein
MPRERPNPFVDEASQCNQATALHLAYRAKRMVVVGDEKQLPNSTVQWLTVEQLNSRWVRRCYLATIPRTTLRFCNEIGSYGLNEVRLTGQKSLHAN